MLALNYVSAIVQGAISPGEKEFWWQRVDLEGALEVNSHELYRLLLVKWAGSRCLLMFRVKRVTGLIKVIPAHLVTHHYSEVSRPHVIG